MDSFNVKMKLNTSHKTTKNKMLCAFSILAALGVSLCGKALGSEGRISLYEGWSIVLLDRTILVTIPSNTGSVSGLSDSNQ